MSTIKTVLFDLDGTLLDTAPDLAQALNQLRIKHDLPELPMPVIRPTVGYGSKTMLKLGFDVDDSHPQYASLLSDFLNYYEKHMLDSTQLFPQMNNVLSHLENHNIPWGIVTNKPARFTHDLLRSLKLDKRAACIVCGDTLPKRKPEPDQILHACNLLQQKPANTLYVGDTSIDVVASKAAGTKSLVALYGYISNDEDPYDWKADGYVHDPIEIIEWLEEQLA